MLSEPKLPRTSSFHKAMHKILTKVGAEDGASIFNTYLNTVQISAIFPEAENIADVLVFLRSNGLITWERNRTLPLFEIFKVILFVALRAKFPESGQDERPFRAWFLANHLSVISPNIKSQAYAGMVIEYLNQLEFESTISHEVERRPYGRVIEWLHRTFQFAAIKLPVTKKLLVPFPRLSRLMTTTVSTVDSLDESGIIRIVRMPGENGIFLTIEDVYTLGLYIKMRSTSELSTPDFKGAFKMLIRKAGELGHKSPEHVQIFWDAYVTPAGANLQKMTEGSESIES